MRHSFDGLRFRSPPDQRAFPLERHLLVYAERLLARVCACEEAFAYVLAVLPGRLRIRALGDVRRAAAARLKTTPTRRSWETTRTNELLTQMENHHGVLICCTNLLENLDPAVLRRFAWKVHFQAPSAEGRRRIYCRYFDAPGNPVPDARLDQVARIDGLTPGDVKAVWVRIQVRPQAAWNHAEIFQALAQEVGYRARAGVVTGFQVLQPNPVPACSASPPTTSSMNPPGACMGRHPPTAKGVKALDRTAHGR
jgi:hypothetical protein